jgi:hypothetical protein
LRGVVAVERVRETPHVGRQIDVVLLKQAGENAPHHLEK